MSFSERRRQRLLDRCSGPLDEESAADLETLSDWGGALVIPMMNLRGETYFVDDPKNVDPYDEGVDIYFTRMGLHSLDRVEVLNTAADAINDEPFDEVGLEHTVFEVNPDLSPGELRAGFVAAAEAVGIPSVVPDTDLDLADAVTLTWVVVGDLIDRITTYLRPLTVHEWQDFANLCSYVLARIPTAATSTDPTTQPASGIVGTTNPSKRPDPSC